MNLKLRHVRSGLTLIEVLVILGIVLLLAALLFPVFSASRRRAQQTACLGNIQQISHALLLYTADYDGTYPLAVEGVVRDYRIEEHTRIWGDLLMSYLHTGFLPACPAREVGLLKQKPRTSSSGYVINRWLNLHIGSAERHTLDGRKEGIVAFPSLTVTLLDARMGMIEAHSPDTAQTPAELEQFFGRPVKADSTTFYLAQPPGGTRHHGGANYTFADGHAKWMQPGQLNTDRKCDGIRPGFGL